MKRTFVIPTVFALLTIAAMSATAQTRPGPAATTPKPAAPLPTPVATAAVPASKIAFVDTMAFGDEKTGIKRYLNAVKSVQDEFHTRTAELLSLQNRIKALADEITKLSGTPVVAPQNIQTKQDEGERLQREFKYKKDQLDADFEKRYNDVVRPISSDIGKALDQYLIQHGLTMILDTSKLESAILTMNPAADITKDFITEYNSKNP